MSVSHTDFSKECPSVGETQKATSATETTAWHISVPPDRGCLPFQDYSGPDFADFYSDVGAVQEFCLDDQELSYNLTIFQA